MDEKAIWYLTSSSKNVGAISETATILLSKKYQYSFKFKYVNIYGLSGSTL